MQLVPSKFCTFDLTSEEELAGQRLNVLQRAVIQNAIAAEAQKRLNLDFNPEAPQLFMQAEAEIKGAIGALVYMLAVAEEADRIAESLINSNDIGE